MKQFYVLTLALLLAGSRIIHGASAMTDEEMAAARLALSQGEQEAETRTNVLPLPNGTVILNTKDNVKEYLTSKSLGNPSSPKLEALKEEIKDGARKGTLIFLNRSMADFCYKLLSDQIKAKKEQEERTGKSAEELADIDSMKEAAAKQKQEQEIKIRQEVNKRKEERGIILRKTDSEKQKQAYQEAVKQIRAEVEAEMKKKQSKKGKK
ncbi:MAG: hypothetical protein EBU90_08955 [Proteobacteria bacterium]|nr:hypothetical protein [Pseudomonadota bacterium]NBP14068.1 hypothetical protein [bacterium]